MKFDKEKFLKTELGAEIKNCIDCWDQALIDERTEQDYLIRKEYSNQSTWCQAQWEAYKLALKHFTGKEYAFTRDDSHYGLINEYDDKDWLFKVRRKIK